jgi:formiminoglutamase
MTPFDVIRGDGPIILGQPHGGTWLPEGMADRLTPIGQALADTDWHIGPLHDGLLPGATIVRSNVHRYVIDANRDPSGSSLYPGQNTTGLCPETDFDGAPLWQPGQAPDADEVAERRALYHAPYHAALAEQIDRVRDRYGVAVLYDCHSIRSNIPFLFKGLLPVFNVGTNDGHSCSVAVTDAVMAPLLASMRSTVLNGRFKGG